MAALIKTAHWPKRDYVVKSLTTVLCQIYLNKLYIPDVLIDIIKDYIYISEAEILKRYHRNCLNFSITQMSCAVSYYVDMYERKRQAHWSTGHDFDYARNSPPIQLQQIMCMTCGEACDYHTTLDKCCPLEFDGEDGTLVLEEVIDKSYEEEEEEYDGYDEDNWYAGDRYGAKSK